MCVLRSRQPGWFEGPGCFASLHSEQGAAPLALPAASIPARFASGTRCLHQTVPDAAFEYPILSARLSREKAGVLEAHSRAVMEEQLRLESSEQIRTAENGWNGMKA